VNLTLLELLQTVAMLCTIHANDPAYKVDREQRKCQAELIACTFKKSDSKTVSEVSEDLVVCAAKR